MKDRVRNILVHTTLMTAVSGCSGNGQLPDTLPLPDPLPAPSQQFFPSSMEHPALPTSTSTPFPTPTSIGEITNTMQVCKTGGDNLNVRERPDRHGNIIGKLRSGETVYLAKPDGGEWQMTRFRDREAYVHRDFLCSLAGQRMGLVRPTTTPPENRRAEWSSEWITKVLAATGRLMTEKVDSTGTTTGYCTVVNIANWGLLTARHCVDAKITISAGKDDSGMPDWQITQVLQRYSFDAARLAKPANLSLATIPFSLRPVRVGDELQGVFFQLPDLEIPKIVPVTVVAIEGAYIHYNASFGEEVLGGSSGGCFVDTNGCVAISSRLKDIATKSGSVIPGLAVSIRELAK